MVVLDEVETVNSVGTNFKVRFVGCYYLFVVFIRAIVIVVNVDCIG